MNLLEIKNVKKSFGLKEILKGVDLTVSENCIFGFIGRNGAGKTTLIKSILGLQPIDKGEINAFGIHIEYGKKDANQFIGYLPDVPEYYNYMNARDYLSLCGAISGLSKKEINSRSSELLELVGLKNEKGLIGGYSRGMKQRLGIAQALINRPKLLICDEPTSALDPIGRRDILEIISSVREQTSVIFSTHILSDIERTCDHIALLEQGVIAYSGTITGMKKLNVVSNLELILRNNAEFDKIKQKFINADFCNGTVLFRNITIPEADEIFCILANMKISVCKYELKEPDLETLFMEKINERI